MTEQEWAELLLLEAPSILGVCHPAAAALDVSEPSFCWESSESEASASDVCMDASPLGDSLRGYSPSPCRVNSEAEGFNLAVNLAAIPESLPRFSEAENFAVDLLKKGWATEANLLRLMEMLPVSFRPCQVGDDSSEVGRSGIFCTGAYVYSSSVGLMLHARQFRAVTQLLTSLVNSLNPEHCYSSISLILNTASAPYRDCHNHPHSVNMVVPLSRFGQGQLWIESGGGDVLVNGFQGRLLEIERPYVTFSPKLLHSTMPWTGTRLVMVAYHIRAAHLLTLEDKLRLEAFGFKLLQDC